MNIFTDFAPSETKLLIYMILKSGPDNSITISLNDLSKKTGITVTTITKHLKGFKEKRLIEIVDNREENYHAPNSYLFLFDKREIMKNSLL